VQAALSQSARARAQYACARARCARQCALRARTCTGARAHVDPISTPRTLTPYHTRNVRACVSARARCARDVLRSPYRHIAIWRARTWRADSWNPYTILARAPYRAISRDIARLACVCQRRSVQAGSVRPGCPPPGWVYLKAQAILNLSLSLSLSLYIYIYIYIYMRSPPGPRSPACTGPPAARRGRLWRDIQ
jgi:hypothetical protein